MDLSAIDFINMILCLGAAEVATHVMKQEFFDNDLLNLLSVYSLLKWLELPNDQRVFNVPKVKEETSEEEDFSMEEEEVCLFNHWNIFGLGIGILKIIIRKHWILM